MLVVIMMVIMVVMVALSDRSAGKAAAGDLKEGWTVGGSLLIRITADKPQNWRRGGVFRKFINLDIFQSSKIDLDFKKKDPPQIKKKRRGYNKSTAEIDDKRHLPGRIHSGRSTWRWRVDPGRDARSAPARTSPPQTDILQIEGSDAGTNTTQTTAQIQSRRQVQIQKMRGWQIPNFKQCASEKDQQVAASIIQKGQNFQAKKLETPNKRRVFVITYSQIHWKHKRIE